MSVLIQLDRIVDNPWQTRQAYDPGHIEALALDIERNGLMQNPVGRVINAPDNFDGKQLAFYTIGQSTWDLFQKENPDVRIELAFGHNRLRAFQHLLQAVTGMLKTHWDAIPIDLRPLTDEQMADQAWSENAQRRDLNAVEEARAIQKRMNDFNWTQEQVAEHIGSTRATVSNKLRLLKLPEDLLAKVAAREFSERQAMALLPLYDLPEKAAQRANEGPSYYGPRPKDVLKKAAEMSSDEIRKNVNGAIQNATKQLTGAPFPVDHVFGVIGVVVASTCKECPIRIARGKEGYCPDHDCFNAKGVLFREHQIVQACEATETAAAAESERLNTFDDVEAGVRVVGTGCSNLRLEWSDWGYNSVRPDGFEKIRYGCAAEGGCACLKTAKASIKAEKAESPEALHAKALKAHVAEVFVTPAREALKAALVNQDAKAWSVLLTELRGAYGSGKFDVKTWDGICNKTASFLIDRWLPGEWIWSPKNVHDQLVQGLASVGIDAPWPEATPLEPVPSGDGAAQAEPVPAHA